MLFLLKDTHKELSKKRFLNFCCKILGEEFKVVYIKSKDYKDHY